MSVCNFQFLPTPYTKHLLCPSCNSLFQRPTRLHSCGHTFCFNCIKSKKNCPVCLEKAMVKQDDILTAKLIDSLSVECKSEGCPWKGSYDEFVKFHSKQCRLKDGLEVWLSNIKNSIHSCSGEEKQGALKCEPPKNSKQQSHISKIPTPRTYQNELSCLLDENQPLSKQIRIYEEKEE